MITKFSHPSKEPYNVITEVTTALAIKWLEGNTHNRTVNDAHIKRLAQDIRNGRWQLTHQGIAFDTDDLLVDGQHRLWAVIEAGAPITTRVFFNEPPQNRRVLDSGHRRSNYDILNITGEVGEVTSRHLATLRAMLAGYPSHIVRVTPGQEAEQYQRHRDAVTFAIKQMGVGSVKGVATAQVRAVIARAWYSAEHAKLIHFCDVLRSGMASGEGEFSILMLRDFLISTGGVGGGESVRRLRYAKMQWALSIFLQGKLPKRLRSATSELFPLPEESPASSVA
jgi:hypothetical protein